MKKKERIYAIVTTAQGNEVKLDLNGREKILYALTDIQRIPFSKAKIIRIKGRVSNVKKVEKEELKEFIKDLFES